MTQDKPPAGDEPAPSSQDLREQVEATREELGRTVEVLAAKTDVKARAHEKATEVKQQLAEKTHLVTSRLRGKATHAAHLVQDRAAEPVRAKATAATGQVRDKAVHIGELAREKTPEPLREKADQGRRMARANRAPLFAAASALIAVLVIRRARRRP
ncbi:DUF3618 domain-containing protein [Streptomyces cyaneochromogenes]|uniref:DUF3618 domain-containing protein n=1 Tax=Streptomyces cyaneochromogenes TaxID=2496836 RepID=A0A3S9MJG4_9ACTN|nr:DUF3618 domain-containing protein [Streptomyces cyaneochromogenes]AZQ39304.1 DUF3618 domain-containing protein [Streptomyces cyaneochromogenes]